MKKVLGAVVITSLLSVSAINAMNLQGEELTTSKVYKPTKSVIEKTMTKLGYTYQIDEDGDMLFRLGKGEWKTYLIFDTFSKEKKIWNIQLLAQFSIDPARYDELLIYVNKWNVNKKYPKLSIRDKKTLKLSYNYPIQYGFNPDEFEENVLGIFKTTIDTITKETYSMRK